MSGRRTGRKPRRIAVQGAAPGVEAVGCVFWQPRTNSLAHGGSEVEYTYRVVRPLTAILTKVSDDDLQAFQDAIFLQDLPILESQSPKGLPLAAGAELSVPSDAMSLAYRRYLRSLGLRFGVHAAGEAS